MPSTVNYLSNADSLRRFPGTSTVDHTPRYLENNNSPRYGWTAINASVETTGIITKLPTCNSLLIAPTGTSPITLSLYSTIVPGTVRQGRSPIDYLFHCLVRTSADASVLVDLHSQFANTTGRTTLLTRDQFVVCRSNIIRLDDVNQMPSSAYLGSDPTLDIHITINNHGGNVIYMTFPALIDMNAWKLNASVPNATRFIPTMFKDIDEQQDPEFPFYRLIDVLTHRMGDVSQIYSNWFRFEADELPADALETDAWVRSQLVDPAIASDEYLPWMGNIVGAPVVQDIYAVNPTNQEVQGWNNSAYPLDMTTLVTVDLVATAPISIIEELIVVDKWLSAKTVTTSSINLSTELIDGAVFGGVAVATGDRVLVKHQLDTTQNGIYVVVASGAASRSTDADASGEFTTGKALKIDEGTSAGVYWAASVPSSFTLGTDPVSFSETNAPGVVDDVDLEDGSTVLLTNQNDPRENGVYEVSSSSSAVRIAELDSSSEFVSGTYIEVTSGTRFSGSLWGIFVEETIVLDTTPILFTYIDRTTDFWRSQVSTAMYGHAAGTLGSINNSAKRLLTGTRGVAISPNSPSQFVITVKTLLDETPGLDQFDMWSACRVATIDDINLATELENGDVIDGITLSTGNRVLVKAQTTTSDNGIYVVQASGAAVRATDADVVAEFVANKSVYVEFGELHGDTYFTIDDIPTTMGSSPISFVVSETLGSSAAILSAIEPCRPLGHTFIHQAIHKFSFTFNSPSLGRLGQGSLS